jgi:hypothetical protein
MQKITITAPLFQVEITGETERDLFKPAAFWLSLPKRCAVCDHPLILDYRFVQNKHHYYELKCTGTPFHKVNLGQAQADGSLYFDDKKPWTLRGGEDLHDSNPPQLTTPTSASHDPAKTPKTTSPTEPPVNGVATLRNDLLKLLKETQSRNIRTGYVPGDVPGMDEAELRKAIETVGGFIINA